MWGPHLFICLFFSPSIFFHKFYISVSSFPESVKFELLKILVPSNNLTLSVYISFPHPKMAIFHSNVQMCL